MTFEWSYKNVSNNTYTSVNDYFMINCPSYSASPLVSKRVGKHALTTGESYSFSYTYTIPISRFNSESGLLIRVGVQFQSEYIALLEKKIKPIDARNINPLDYRSSPYVIADRSFYLNESKLEEKFLFDEYRDYVECDEYNRLLFSNLTFKYSYPESLIYKNARIKFMDREDLFPDLKKDGDGYVSIKATLVEKEGVVSIELPSIYYDPITLMCNEDGIGNKSRYLYAPKGKSQKLKDYEFIVEVEELGINKTSFSHGLETSISPFYLGDCESGDYCIVGGVKE